MTPKLKEEVLKRLDALIQEGQQVVAGAQRLAGVSHREISPHETKARAFMTSVGAEIARLAGRESEYFRQLPPPRHDGMYISSMDTVVSTGLGAVQALRVAIDGNFLEGLETRVRSALHDDFVQQAVDLLAAGYHIAAMVIIGGVLENRLRDLCRARGATPKSDKISAYNEALRDVEYTQATWRQIQVIADLRNNSAHALYDQVTPAQVDDAVRFVQRFLAEHEA